MRPEDAKKLLGGYATGTLTDAEQQALFAAALEDQELFDAVAREQSLRDVLADPDVKAELLAALDEPPKRWWSWRPAAVLAVAAVAAVAVIVVRQKAPPPVTVAEVRAGQVREAPVPPKVEMKADPEPTKRKAVVGDQLSAAKPSAVGRLEKRGFQRQPVVGEGAGNAPRAMAAPAAPLPVQPQATTPAMSLVPAEKAEASNLQVRVVAGASAVAPVTGARDLFNGSVAGFAALADTAALRTLGIRYSVLRKEGADFVEVDPDSLQESDTVALRFTANTNGFLSIDGATPVAITAMQPYTTPAIDGVEVKVVFARTPETAAEGSVSTERRARQTYVVNTPPASAIAFTITLKRK